jgi:flagellar rod assembly protein/muramidase FlgJ
MMSQLLVSTKVYSAPKTAAETDWVTRNQLPPSQQAKLGPVCSGAYVSPVLTPLAAGQDANTVLGAADHADYSVNKQFKLQGHVVLRQGDFQLESQSASLNQSTNQATLTGGIQIRGRDLLLKGDQAEYHLNSGQFDLDNASYLLHDRQLRGRASHISRHELTQLDIDKGTYTTCPPDDKGWSFAASHIHLDKQKGEGSARNVRFRIQDVPVFYLPWFSFPIDNRRKSGFLYPTFGTSNVGHGAFFSIPYYFNLAPNYDLTLTPQYINGRGIHTEAQFRYLNSFSRSTVSGGYIAHDSAFNDLYPDLSPQRWGFKLDNNTQYSSRWEQTINFNAVSDKDYLSDLSRTLRIDTQTELDREIKWTYSGDWAFSALFHGYQTVDKSIADMSNQHNSLLSNKKSPLVKPLIQDSNKPVDAAGSAIKLQADSETETFSSPQDFIQTLYPVARQVEKETGINARLMLAQSALETGWGKRMIQNGDKTNSHNLFGIKADSRWSGKVAQVVTTEYRDGIPMKQKADFRSYASFKASFEDYASFLNQNPRYHQALSQTSSPEEFAKSLQDAGYATDPNYASKIADILHRDYLAESSIKNNLGDIMPVSDAVSGEGL